MLGEETAVTSMKIAEEILKLLREILKSYRNKEKSPKILTGEKDLNKLIKSGEDMVAIQEELSADEIEKFRELADKMGILYSVVENPLEEGKSLIFVKRADLEKADICFQKIFANKVIENAKEEAIEKGISEEEFNKAVELFTAEENHMLNQKGITFEDALDHITDRDYAREQDYFLFDRNNPDKYMKLHSEKATDHNGKEYTKTTYTTYYKGKEIASFNDGRFPGRDKMFWYNLKKQMKSEVIKDGIKIPEFSDNLFILNSQEELEKFQNVYNKQLGYIKDNQGKRLDANEIRNFKEFLSNDNIIKNVPSEMLNKLKNNIDTIQTLQNEIETNKIKCFDLYEPKENETKEMRRDRQEKINTLTDEIKNAEIQLTKEYMNKDEFIDEIEEIIGNQLEKEVYEKYEGEVVSNETIQKEESIQNEKGENFEDTLFISAPEEYIQDIATFAKNQGINVAVMNDPQNPDKKIYTSSEIKGGTHQDIESFWKSQGVSSISIMYDPDKPDRPIIVVTRENYDEIKMLIDKTVENHVFENMKETTNLSQVEYNVFMNNYGEKVVENMNHDVNTVGDMINQVSQRYSLQNKEVYICDKQKPFNFIKAENIVSEGRISNLYTVSKEGKEERFYNAIDAKQAFGENKKCYALPDKKQYEKYNKEHMKAVAEKQKNNSVRERVHKIEHGVMER